METLYRKVAVSERKPTKTGNYFTNKGFLLYSNSYKGFEHYTRPHRIYPDWWLEPIPEPNTQLKADKEELLEAEKEQITEAYTLGHSMHDSNDENSAEHYYTQTFKSDE